MFEWTLSLKLGMPRSQMLAELTPGEINSYRAYYLALAQLEHEAQQDAEKAAKASG